jgi:hypothetical protein
LLGQRAIIGMGMAAVLVLSGCYGSTEPATNVGIDRATLNAQGTANNGPARAHFEYEVNGRVGDPLTAFVGRFPAGASGPFSKLVTGLAAATTYSFRVCGTDENGGETACAQTRTFTTRPPVEDAVFGGYWSGCCNSWAVDAKSGPSGENPQGFIRWHTGPSGFDPYSHDFDGTVTCLRVEGSRAAVVAVGAIRHSSGAPDTPTTSTAIVVDGRAGVDSIYDPDIPGTTPPDCEDLTGSLGQLDSRHELIVNDAQP